MKYWEKINVERITARTNSKLKVWVECPICHEEYQTVTAPICPDCARLEAKKRFNEKKVLK